MINAEESGRLLAEMFLGGSTTSSRPHQTSGDGVDDHLFSQHIDSAMRKGLPPVYSAVLRPAWYNRNVYDTSMENTKKLQSRTNSQQGVVALNQTMRPALEHGIAPSLETVKPTTLRHVAEKVNHIHLDRVIFVTTMCEAHRQVGTNVLVEDDAGDCLMLSVYNFVQKDEDPEDIFPVGSHLAILCPYMKNARDDRDLQLFLRCDNPQCVILYDSMASWLAAKTGKVKSPETGTASSLREKGNTQFRLKRLKAAARYYSRALNALDIGNEDKIACLGNNAEVSLRREEYEDAERYARLVLDLDQSHHKAQFRLSKSLLYQGKVSEAHSLAKELLLTSSPNEKIMFENLVFDIESAISEANGRYDSEKMREEAASSSPMPFHADFVSPHILIGTEIKAPSLIESYRGCKCIADIEENELLTASKAFAFVPVKEALKGVQINPYTKQMDKGSQIQLFSEIIALLQRRPSQGGRIYRLSCGKEFPEEMPACDIEKIHLQRIYAIINSNTFSEISEGEEVLQTWNRHVESQRKGRPLTESEIDSLESWRSSDRGSGLWVIESMFNHSCVPNCAWTQIGNHMFIRSTRPINAGEELCISYCGTDDTYPERLEKFRGWIKPGEGFECACEWCHTLRNNKVLRDMEVTADAAHKTAARMVTFDQIPMAVAAERAIPSHRRQAMLSKFAEFPLRIQHNAAAKIEIFEGVCLNHRGDSKGALECFQRASDIGYAVRGGGSMNYAKDQWRVAGAAMACNDPKYSKETLEKIWANVFARLPSKEDAVSAFVDLTVNYTLPWWADHADHNKRCRMEQLARSVCDGRVRKAIASGKKGKKKGKRRGR